MPEPEIIYEDKNFLALNKPAGLVVHGTANFHEPTLVDWLLKRYPEIRTVGDDPVTRPGIVHRLDKDTSGIMLVAKNQKYFEYLKSLFQERKIKKIYLALVYGKLNPKIGTIKKAIGIKNGTTKRSVYSEKMAKEAITEYKVKKYLELENDTAKSEKSTIIMQQLLHNDSGEGGPVFSFIEVEPKTGRTHQIRVHLASIGHPIVGDRLYGKRKQPVEIRLMLHALSLEFTTDEGRRLKLEAEPPGDFVSVLGTERD